MPGMLDHLDEAGKDMFRKSTFAYNNATPGTGIAINATPTTLVDTEAALVIYNSANADAGDNQWVVPIGIKLTCTAAGTAATDARLVFYIDSANRWASGGTALTGKATSSYVQASGTYTDRTPKGVVHFGDLTASAATSEKLIANQLIKTAIAPCFTVGDVYSFGFGNIGSAGFIDAAAHKHFNLPPVWIGAGCSLVVRPLCAAMTAAPSFEVEIVTIEPGHPANS